MTQVEYLMIGGQIPCGRIVVDRAVEVAATNIITLATKTIPIEDIRVRNV